MCKLEKTVSENLSDYTGKEYIIQLKADDVLYRKFILKMKSDGIIPMGRYAVSKKIQNKIWNAVISGLLCGISADTVSIYNQFKGEIENAKK